VSGVEKNTKASIQKLLFSSLDDQYLIHIFQLMATITSLLTLQKAALMLLTIRLDFCVWWDGEVKKEQYD